MDEVDRQAREVMEKLDVGRPPKDARVLGPETCECGTIVLIVTTPGGGVSWRSDFGGDFNRHKCGVKIRPRIVEADYADVIERLKTPEEKGDLRS